MTGVRRRRSDGWSGRSPRIAPERTLPVRWRQHDDVPDARSRRILGFDQPPQVRHGGRGPRRSWGDHLDHDLFQLAAVTARNHVHPGAGYPGKHIRVAASHVHEVGIGHRAEGESGWPCRGRPGGSGSSTDGFRRMRSLTSVNIAAFAPMPSASERIAVAVNPGVRPEATKGVARVASDPHDQAVPHPASSMRFRCHQPLVVLDESRSAARFAGRGEQLVRSLAGFESVLEMRYQFAEDLDPAIFTESGGRDNLSDMARQLRREPFGARHPFDTKAVETADHRLLVGRHGHAPSRQRRNDADAHHRFKQLAPFRRR